MNGCRRCSVRAESASTVPARVKKQCQLRSVLPCSTAIGCFLRCARARFCSCAGFPLVSYLSQVFGNDRDLLKGRQMPSHMSGRSANVVSWSSCIGTQLTHAVGAAWAAKLRRESMVSAACLGDGATSSADFHSAMNFAQVFRVPCVFVCQNNQWAISTPAARQSNTRTFSERALAYAMPAERLDGNDVCGLYLAFQRAAEHARKGLGPTFLECVTYRVGPHSTSDDPTLYRSEAEVSEWRTRDPIARLPVRSSRKARWTPPAAGPGRRTEG